MFDVIATVLAWFYDHWSSYGGAIILLTLTVMIIVTPITLSGTKSMIKMQRLQPELKRIQAKYKDDRQKMNEEMMAFYQANNINPVGGCLPMLVQIPIFIVLFNVIRGLTRTTTSVGLQLGQFSADAYLGDPVRGVNNTPRTFNPAYLDHDSSLYRDLTDTTEMTSWGIDLARSASQQLSEGIVDALPYLLMIAVVAITGFVQQRQIMGRNPNAAANPQQQMIMKIMPVFLPVISFGMPAALVVYFLVSNLYRIGQQAYITRSLYGDKAEHPEVIVPDLEDEPKKSKKSSSAKGDSSADSGAGSKGGSKSKGTSSASSSSPSSEAKRRRTTAGSRPPKRSSSAKKSSGDTSANGSSKRTTSRRVSQPGQPQHRSKKKKR